MRGPGPRDAQEKLQSNLRALTELGYLKECRVVLSNGAIDRAISVMRPDERDPLLWKVEQANGKYAIVITGTDAHLCRFSNLLRKIDDETR